MFVPKINVPILTYLSILLAPGVGLIWNKVQFRKYEVKIL